MHITMATGDPSSIAQQQPTDPVTPLTDCPLCGSLCLGPSLLSCGHVLCRGCLHEELQHLCPPAACQQCGRPLDLPATGQRLTVGQFVRQMGTDPVMVQLVRQALENRPDVRCLNCSNKPAANVCLDCQEDYCDFCTVIHQRSRASKSHALQQLPQYMHNATTTLSSSSPPAPSPSPSPRSSSSSTTTTLFTSSQDGPPLSSVLDSQSRRDGETSRADSQGEQAWEEWVGKEVDLLQQASREQQKAEDELQEVLSFGQRVLDRMRGHQQVLETYRSHLLRLRASQRTGPITYVIGVRGSDVSMGVETEAMERRLRDVRERRQCPDVTVLMSVTSQLGRLLNCADQEQKPGATSIMAASSHSPSSTPTPTSDSLPPPASAMNATSTSMSLPLSAPSSMSLLLSTPTSASPSPPTPTIDPTFTSSSIPPTTPTTTLINTSPSFSNTFSLLPPTPTSSSLPLSTSTSVSLPLFTSTSVSLPLSTPTSGSLPLSTPTSGSLPLSTPTSTSLPLSTPTSGSLPLSTPTSGSLPLSTPTSTSLPLSTPTSSSLLQSSLTTPSALVLPPINLTTTTTTTTTTNTTTTTATATATAIPRCVDVRKAKLRRVFALSPTAAEDTDPTPRVTAMVCLPDDRLVMTDYSNDRVKVMGLSPPHTVICSRAVPEEPLRLAVLPDGVVALTTRRPVIYLMRVSDTAVALSPRIQTRRQYWGVAGHSGGHLLVSCRRSRTGPAAVDLLTRKGELVRTVMDSASLPELTSPGFLCRDGEDRVLVSDFETHKVYVVAVSSGQVTQTHPQEDADLLRWPAQVCSDTAGGQLYVANRGGECVQARDRAGRWRELLTASQHSDPGYVKPWGMCLTRSGNLVVAWRKQYHGSVVICYRFI